MALRRPLVALAASLSEAGAALLRPQQGAAPLAAQLQQARGGAHNSGISIDVPHGNVDKAYRNLTRKLREEHYMQAAQSRQFYMKPSERRKIEGNAAKRRQARAEFDQMLSWIMRRRSRGF